MRFLEITCKGVALASGERIRFIGSSWLKGLWAFSERAGQHETPQERQRPNHNQVQVISYSPSELHDSTSVLYHTYRGLLGM